MTGQVTLAAFMAVIGITALAAWHSYWHGRAIERWRHDYHASIQRQLDLAAGRTPRPPDLDAAYAAELARITPRMDTPYDWSLSPFGEEGLRQVLTEERETA